MEALLVVLGATVTILLTLLVTQVMGLRSDTRDLIKVQQDLNNRLIELETEHRILWLEHQGSNHVA